MNDEMAEAWGGRGIPKDRLFFRAPDIKISQEQGAPDLLAWAFYGFESVIWATRPSKSLQPNPQERGG